MLMADGPEFPADRVFVHLSDIHFRDGRSGDVRDADNDLRNELELDLRTISTTRVLKIDGIIVSSDVAFAGHPNEFEFAKGWLRHVSELIACSADSIMVTPGSHDVDRQRIEEGGDPLEFGATSQSSPDFFKLPCEHLSIRRHCVWVVEANPTQATPSPAGGEDARNVREVLL